MTSPASFYLVVKSDRVQFVLRPRWHVRQGLSGVLVVLEDVLDGRAKVEGLDQGRLVQGQGVADTSNLGQIS